MLIKVLFLQVGIPVPQPYPVAVPKPVAVPVPQPVAVPVVKSVIGHAHLSGPLLGDVHGLGHGFSSPGLAHGYAAHGYASHGFSGHGKLW